MNFRIFYFMYKSVIGNQIRFFSLFILTIYKLPS